MNWTAQSAVDHLYHLAAGGEVYFARGVLRDYDGRSCLMGHLIDPDVLMDIYRRGDSACGVKSLSEWSGTADLVKSIGQPLVSALINLNDRTLGHYGGTEGRQVIAQGIRDLALARGLEDPARSIGVDWEVRHVDESICVGSSVPSADR